MSDKPDTDTRDQIADTPRQLPANALEQLHVADLFWEATPPGVMLDASTNQKPTNEGDDVHTNVVRGLDDRPILTWVGQGYDPAEAAMLLADESEHTPPASPITDSSSRLSGRNAASARRDGWHLYEASPSSSDCMTLRSDTRSPVS